MKGNGMYKFLLIIIIICILTLMNGFSQDNFHWDKELVSKVKIDDKSLIDKLVMELFIPEAVVDYIELFDVDANGPGEGDLLKTYPSRTVYPLYMLSKDNPTGNVSHDPINHEVMTNICEEKIYNSIFIYGCLGILGLYAIFDKQLLRQHVDRLEEKLHVASSRLSDKIEGKQNDD